MTGHEFRARGREIHDSCEIYDSNENSQAIAFKCYRVQIHVGKRVLGKTKALEAKGKFLFNACM